MTDEQHPRREAQTTTISKLLCEASMQLKRKGRYQDAARMTIEALDCDSLAGAWLVVRRYLEGDA